VTDTADSNAQDASVLPAPEHAAPAARTGTGVRLALLLLLLTSFVLVVVCGSLWMRFSALNADTARRMQQLEQGLSETKALARQAADELRTAQGRLVVAEARIEDYAAQRAALDRLLADNAQREQARTVAEIEQLLTLAEQESQLASSPTVLLAALKTIEARADAAPPGLRERLKAAIAKDSEALRKTEWADRNQLLLRFDELARLLDELPFAAEVRAQPRPPGKPASAAQPPAAVSAASPWRDWLAAFFAPVSDWFEIRRIDAPDALLATPEQLFWLRENLKLQVQSARLSLLARQADAYYRSLARAQAALQRHADAKQPKVQQALALLQQLQAVRVSPDMPRPRETRAVLAAAGVR
jgi:uroporphyrin-3 C-methyltransferase